MCSAGLCLQKAVKKHFEKGFEAVAMEQKRKRGVAIARMVALDLLAFGAALLIFAYFHHVRVEPLRPVALAGNTPAPAAELPSAGAPLPTPGEDNASHLPTPAPTGLLGGKYAEKFSRGGVVFDDAAYRSQNVAIERRTEYVYESIVHVLDIYIQDIECFRTAVYDDFENSTMKTQDMARRAGAIAAISGDYFSAHLNEDIFIVRNGQAYMDEAPNRLDTCVLYYDGVMETIPAAEFDREALLARGVYQAWCFGPGMLDENGMPLEKYRSTVRTNNPRSAIGYIEPGHYCFVMVEGRSRESNGMTLEQLGEFFHSLGCKAAYNLDGGKTAEIVWNDTLVNARIDGGRPVSDIVYIIDPENTGAANGGGGME